MCKSVTGPRFFFKCASKVVFFFLTVARGSPHMKAAGPLSGNAEQGAGCWITVVFFFP